MEKLIVIVGQTSSGKSGLAINLARHFDGEIVSADSRQVYAGLDWCSGKVTKEEREMAVHHLLDVVNLGERFTLFDFQKMAYKKIDDIINRKKVPFLVGGTGLYSRAVVEGYDLTEVEPDEKLRNDLLQKTKEELILECKTHHLELPDEITHRRLVRILEKFYAENEQNIVHKNQPKYEVLQIGIKWPREKIYERIDQRLKKRMPFMLEEIKELLKKGVSKEFLMSLGLEAKHIILYLENHYKNYDEFYETLLKEERHFAKRQSTWYNKEKNIVWLDAEENLFENAKSEIEKFLTNN